MNIKYPKQALRLAQIILFGVVVFHVLVISGLIPSTVIWGGNLQSRSEVLLFETISIVVNVIMIGVLYRKYSLLVTGKRSVGIDVLIGVFALMFAVNTVGNLYAVHVAEKWLGTFFTALLTLLFVISLIPPQIKNAPGNAE
ncbi:MAG: hypothetical protein QM534_06555 [Sediminibacterium sp.]|nr:hypothetical protein [Sediminibacterium sp.]